MSWTAILLLAGGSYLFKALGLLVLGPAAGRTGGHRRAPAGAGAGDASAGRTIDPGRHDPTGGAGWPMRIGQLLPPALLAALVVSQTVVDGTDLVVDARLAGVVAGAVAVWRRAPFWLVLAIAAATTALIRLAGG